MLFDIVEGSLSIPKLDDQEIKLGDQDKITKRPVKIENHLYFLGRQHIHVIDLTNFKTECLQSKGEDNADNIS